MKYRIDYIWIDENVWDVKGETFNSFEECRALIEKWTTWYPFRKYRIVSIEEVVEWESSD